MSELPAPSSPYKGLAAFEDSAVDALFFFGRDRDSQVIAANLMASRLTVLFGPTGVGKTSVLRAGVAYKLRQEAGVDVRIHSSWIGDPGDALANLTPGAGRDIYLMLDQFEEFFLYHEQNRSFVEELADVIRRAELRVNVLIGIREDALALLDAFKAVIPNLLSNRLRLENLDRAAGEAAIRGPLERFNELVPAEARVDAEPALVEAVLDEVVAGRVDLAPVGRGVVTAPSDDDRIEAPYLQLVMSRLWEVEAERGSKLLRRQTLTELGGATQIVQDHLEHAMADLSPRQKDAAAAMYNFLVTPSGSKIAHRTRDLAGYAEIEEEEAADVLRQLAAERIVRASSENGAGARYEIYHDVLADAVAGWGARYRAERSLHDAERRRRRALGVAAAALVGLILVAGIAVFALVERSHSRAQAQRARARELAAAASSFLDVNPQRGIKLAMQAAQLERGAHEEEVLRDALLAAQQRLVFRTGSPVRVAGFDQSGRHVVTGSKDGKVRVYRVGSGTPEHVLDQGARVTAATYGAEGQLILTAGRDGTARIWGKDGTPLRTLEAGGPVTTAFFASHSRRVLTIARHGVIRLWRTGDGKLLRTIVVHGKALAKGAAVSPSGRLLVTYGQDRFARMYSLLTGRIVSRLEHKGLVHCVAFSPNGSKFLTCGHEGVVRLWSSVNGRQIRALRGPEPGSAITDAVFSPNGILVAAAVTDGTARVWEAPTGFQLGVMFGHSNPTTKVAFNASGKSIVTGSPDTRARTWLTNGKPVAILAGHTGAINSVAFSPDGRSVLTASEDGTARLWASGTEPDLVPVARQKSITAFALSMDRRRVIVGDARGVARVREIGRSRVLATARVRGPVTAVAFGPRGPIVATRPTLSLAVSDRSQRVARGRTDGSVTISRTSGGPAQLLRMQGAPVTALAFSPDEALLAIGDSNGRAGLWDLRSGRMVRVFAAHTAPVTSVEFSPDGKLLLTASRDHEARVWFAQTGRLKDVIRWHFGPVAEATFSPDGRWILTAGPSAAGVGPVSTARRLLLLRGHIRPLVGAAFGGRDGQTIVTASKDGTIRVYRCEICGGIDQLLVVARHRLRAG
jgi:WD40 repeat protein